MEDIILEHTQVKYTVKREAYANKKNSTYLVILHTQCSIRCDQEDLSPFDSVRIIQVLALRYIIYNQIMYTRLSSR